MSSESLSSETLPPAGARNQTDVYAVHGADPEVLAYAMAKYSRSSLSMRESLTEISAQRAEQFLNTFYFQYGHRSIADLAHIAFAVERLSLLAAIVLVDEQRWDGQERSTRYQNFQKSGWYFPEFGSDQASAKLYSDTVENLFATYQRTTAAVHEALRKRVVCPEAMKPEAYDRTLKARAFDVARYLLPLATNTSLGQIVNARTLETQVSRLLSHPIAEVRDLGAKLRDAATGPAWNVNARAGAAFVEKVGDAELSAEAANLFTREVRTAPTLVKYAEPNQYLIQTQIELKQAAQEILKGIALESSPVVDLVERTESLEVELAATLHLLGQRSSLSPSSQYRGRATWRARCGNYRAGFEASRTARRSSAGISRRSRVAFRHPHGHRRLSRHASSPPRYADPAGLHCRSRLRHTPLGRCCGTGRGRGACRLSIRHRICARGQRENRFRLCARGRRFSTLPVAAGHARSLPLQNGFRGSAIHQRTAIRSRRPLQLSACSLGDVSGSGAPASDTGEIYSRYGLQQADRSTATVSS